MHITKTQSTIIHKAAEMFNKPTSISGKEQPETKGMFSTMNSFCALYLTDIYRIIFSPKKQSVYEAKGAMFKRLQRWVNNRLPFLAQTVDIIHDKRVLINTRYMPKVHMPRMISIRVKSYSPRLSSRIIQIFCLLFNLDLFCLESILTKLLPIVHQNYKPQR